VETPAGGGSNGSESSALALNVELVESLGSESFVYGRPVGAEEGSDRVTVRLDKRTHLTVGDTVHVEPNHGEVHLFDAASGERIEA
jgi:sn-glycerol 3-phosphate transport system ATP-binding protein/multiple sugar transport system ATP-binding protein